MSLLRVENVTRRFDGLVAIDDVSFTVTAGRITAIIGPNGAGKTTLFNVISGFLPPTEGRVFFADEEVTGVVPERMAGRGLVRTFQLVQLFQNLSVLENVKVAMDRKQKAGVLAGLVHSGLHHREEDRIDGEARDLLRIFKLEGLAEERAKNIHVGAGVSEAEFVKLRTERDKTLAVPQLLIPSIQINMRAGEMPPPEDNGVSYIKIPLNRI